MKRFIKYSIAALLCCTLVITLSFSSFGAATSTSLPHIEEIVTMKQPFDILEIADEGQFGYYIAGQEPTGNWKAVLSAARDSAARTTYMAQLKQKVAPFSNPNKTAAPLTWSDYQESYVWQNRSNKTPLILKTPERQTVPGILTKTTGDYKLIWSYELSPNGGYAQDVAYFTKPSDGGSYHYYNPTFQAVNKGNSSDFPDLDIGTAIYSKTPGGYYEYVGSVGSDLSLDVSVQYYKADSIGPPSATKTDYAAVPNTTGDGFKPETGGSFRRIAAYEYVGNAKGDYSFQYQKDAKESYTIAYQTIYTSGGYTNNNWFLKYAFDRTDDDLNAVNLHVTTVAPENVTSKLIQESELIVISAKGSTEHDIIPARAVELYNCGSMSQKIPFLIDASETKNTSNQSNLQKLKQIMLTKAGLDSYGLTDLDFGNLVNDLQFQAGQDLDFVKGNIYSFLPVESTMPSILNNSFYRPYADSSGFEAIKTEINNENFLRVQQGLPKLADLTSMSTAIRYVINFGGQRVFNAKTALKVLELQPGRGHVLTAETVKTWLGFKQKETAPTIEIVTMSTAEFIGKIENLNETYDMIYIGSSTDGFHLKTKETTDFNDDRMDGMLYTNIGDLYTASINMAGLLNRDFLDETFESNGKSYRYVNARSNSKAKTFRSSGNDLTAAKAKELQDFASAGYPIILEDNLYHPISELKPYAFSLEVKKSNQTLTATPKKGDSFPGGSLTYDYKWYHKDTGVQCSTTADFTPTTSGTYYCELTISGLEINQSVAARSNDWEFSSGSDTLTLSDPKVFYYPNGAIIKENEPMPTNASVFAEVTPSIKIPDVNYAFTWQKFTRTNSGWKWVNIDQPPFDFSDSSFRCAVTITGKSGITINPQTIYSKTIQFSDKLIGTVPHRTYSLSKKTLPSSIITSTPALKDVKNTDQPGSISVPTGASVLGPNPARIDNSSYLYESLSSIREKSNVMNVSQAKAGPMTVLRYVNLSKPKLVFTDIPTKYEMNNGIATKLDPIGDAYFLNYQFNITNETDATPAATSYDCRLYIDQNADGKYSVTEQVTDLILTSGTRLVTPSDGIYRLAANTDYNISRQMPMGYVGFIAWKLEVIKNGANNIHASQHGYTRIEAETPNPLKILQINSSRGKDTIDLQDQMKPTFTDLNGNCTAQDGKTYKGIYGKLLADVKDFSVSIDSVITTDLDDPKKIGVGQTVSDYLDAYDMIIIGFDDMYQEFSTQAATAIVSFIETGKSVLFTHDTTSVVNLPINTYQMKTDDATKSIDFNTDPLYWGYEFNTKLRDPLRLDRYGIRSPLSGLLFNQTDSTDLSKNDIKTLIDNHYSVAFQPNSDRSKTLPETQGYTSYTLDRYFDKVRTEHPPFAGDYASSGTLSIRSTSYISQVNEGQITTYPYDVNVSTSSPYMQVGETHEQYYQINLNSDDIVVWYCLTNNLDANGKPTKGVYSALPNDVTNAYYIYSKGNITYSGGGHRTPSGQKNYLADKTGNVGAQYVNEAKLFVNTMIAAYRTSKTAQTVSFTDSKDGMKTLPYLLLPSDAEQLLATTQSIFFKPVDANLGVDTKKTLSATFSYCTATDKTQVPLTIDTLKYAGNETDADCKELQGGLVYRFPIPQPVLDALILSDSVTITVTLTSTLNKESATSQIELRKIGLFNLT